MRKFLLDRLRPYVRRLREPSPGLTAQLDRLERQLAEVSARQPSQGARPYYYLGGNRALTQLANGLPFFVNTDDMGVVSWIILIGRWEIFVDEVLSRLCRPGMRVLDLGANVGYYTVRLAHLAGPDGYVMSLEPNPELFPFVRDNVEINGFLGRVRVEQVAAGAEEGVMALHYDAHNMGGGTLYGHHPSPHAATAQVRTAPLDALTQGEPGFDLIKIDVEGWEPEVLRGMTATLERSAHASIVCEVAWGHWRRFGDPGDILRRLLGERSLFIIHHDGGLQRVDPNDLTPFQDQLRYALLTHWDTARMAQLGELVRAA